MNLRYAFEIAIANEKAMRDLYKDLSKREESEPEVSKFWETMSKHEEGHAKVLKTIMADLEADLLRQDVDFEAGTLDQMAADIEQFCTLLKNKEMSNDEIFRFAIEMEMCEQNRVFLHLLKKAPENLGKDVYQQMAVPIGRHIKGLLEIVEKHGKDEKLLLYVRSLRNNASLQ